MILWERAEKLKRQLCISCEFPSISSGVCLTKHNSEWRDCCYHSFSNSEMYHLIMFSQNKISVANVCYCVRYSLITYLLYGNSMCGGRSIIFSQSRWPYCLYHLCSPTKYTIPILATSNFCSKNRKTINRRNKMTNVRQRPTKLFLRHILRSSG